MKWSTKEKWIGDRLCFYFLRPDLFVFCLLITKSQFDLQIGWFGVTLHY